jgi:hypothetical protein
MELITIYKGTEINGKRPMTFLPNGAPFATVACVREHNLDYDEDRLVIPSVNDPSFTASGAFMAARSAMFGLRLATQETPPETPTPEPPRKRKRKSHEQE